MRARICNTMARSLIFFYLSVSAMAEDKGVLIDMDEYHQARTRWEGLARTNALVKKELEDVKKEIARLESLRLKNTGLRPKVQELDKLIFGMMGEYFIEWNLVDGKPFLAQLIADYGDTVEFKLYNGKVLRLERSKLAVADVQFLDQLKAYCALDPAAVQRAEYPPPAENPSQESDGEMSP